MAMRSLRLRRALGGFSTLRRSLTTATPALSSASSSSPSFHGPSPSVQPQSRSLILQSRAFRSSSASLLAFRPSQGGGHGDDEIGPDTILFEGCDYNHWLIVMDFPKDNKPSPEEMVRTYEETCAKGLNISVEEAKLKMYACSTTTYTGFQAVMTEAESEKFNGLPGVIFVLPDSYIDPQNKEYGGDKYENGKITHRPPPVQYGRPSGRFREQPRYDRPRGPMPNQEGNPQYRGQQGPMQGGPIPNQQPNSPYGQQGRPMQGAGGNYGAPQNYPPPPQQNYGPPPGGRNPYPQGGGGPAPPYQGNYNQAPPGNYYPREQRDYAPPPPRQQGGFRDNYGQGASAHQGPGGFGQPGGPQGHGGFGQGAGGHQGPSGFGQAGGPQVHGGFGRGPGPHQGPGGFGQGAGGHQGPGGFGQGAGGHQGHGGFGQGPPDNYSPVKNDQGRY